MKRIETFKEVILYLNDGAILSTFSVREIYLKDKKVHFSFDGNGFVLTMEDFMNLYRNETFYLMEDDEFAIDESKDEDYYRYYRK